MNKLFAQKIKIIIKDNKALFLVLFSWFLGGFLVYFFVVKLGFAQALKASFFLKQINGDFSAAYVIWSQAVVFGVVFTFLFHNIVDKYNPERGCRMIAKEMKNHTVIVGYSHLGERLVSHLIQNKLPYCLIEKDRERVDELLRQGEPVIIDNARELDALKDANIGCAKAVIIASNNLETALIVTKRAREYNKECLIVARCFQDEFVEIVESLGANEVISSSKNAFNDVVKRLQV